MCSVRIKQVNQIFTYVNLKTNQSKIPCTYLNTTALYPLPNRSWKKTGTLCSNLIELCVGGINWMLFMYLSLCTFLWYTETYVKKDMVSYIVGRSGKGSYLSLIFRSYSEITVAYTDRMLRLSMTLQQCITLWIGNLTKQLVTIS